MHDNSLTALFNFYFNIVKYVNSFNYYVIVL